MRKVFIALAAMGLALTTSTIAASAPASTSEMVKHRMQLRAVWDGEVRYPDCPVDQIAPPDTGTLIHIDDPTLCWYGPVHGDINGTIAFWETSANYVVGDVEYFFEAFTFLPDSGGVINGVDEGVFLLRRPFTFSANGWVTATTDEWAALRGAHYFEMGATTDINFWPITAHGTKILFTKATE
jgi:hypothetical protein